MKMLLAIMLSLSGAANAAWIETKNWSGKLDLDPVVSPVALRELKDGQWLAGIAKENIWHLDQLGVQRFHIGLFQAWNAEKGNASFGILAGPDIPLGLASKIGALGEALSLPNFFKPAQYISSVLSINAFGGYRPIHTDDVYGSWVYGVAARLSIAFGVKELQKGL